MTKISTFWYKSVPNFGDFITPELVKHYGAEPVYTRAESAALISTGSILDMTPDSFSGCILGSGFILEETNKTFPNAHVASVRGELTKGKLNLKDVVLGDPGLLLGELYEAKDTTSTVGIIPHYVDKNDIRIKRLGAMHRDVKIINVQLSPEEVFHEISTCQYILSSSLHGVIAADSLGIRNGWISLSDKVIGNGFKFHDHFSISGTPQCQPYTLTGNESVGELIYMTHPVSTRVNDVVGKLNDKYAETIKNLI